MAQPSKQPETKSEGREVSYAVTHAAIFLPGLGQFGPTLIAGSGSTVSRIGKMYLADSTFLTVIIGKDTVLIPLMNVTHIKLA
jgi:hypothetical protein